MMNRFEIKSRDFVRLRCSNIQTHPERIYFFFVRAQRRRRRRFFLSFRLLAFLHLRLAWFMAVEHSFGFIALPEVEPRSCLRDFPSALSARVPRASKIDSVEKALRYSPIRWLGRVVAIGAALLAQRVGGVVVGHRLTRAGRLAGSGGSDGNYRNLFQLKRALCLLRRCLHQMRHVQTIFMLSMHIHKDKQSVPKKGCESDGVCACLFYSSRTLWPG